MKYILKNSIFEKNYSWIRWPESIVKILKFTMKTSFGMNDTVGNK